MSIKATGRLNTRVRLISVTDFQLENSHIPNRPPIVEYYQCITMERIDTGKELRAFVRLGTGFQQDIARIVREHGTGHEFALWCQIPDGQKANNHLAIREHEEVKYTKVNYCQLSPWKGVSQTEAANRKAAKIAARKARLGL